MELVFVMARDQFGVFVLTLQNLAKYWFVREFAKD